MITFVQLSGCRWFLLCLINNLFSSRADTRHHVRPWRRLCQCCSSTRWGTRWASHATPAQTASSSPKDTPRPSSMPVSPIITGNSSDTSLCIPGVCSGSFPSLVAASVFTFLLHGHRGWPWWCQAPLVTDSRTGLHSLYNIKLSFKTSVIEQLQIWRNNYEAGHSS